MRRFLAAVFLTGAGIQRRTCWCGGSPCGEDRPQFPAVPQRDAGSRWRRATCSELRRPGAAAAISTATPMGDAGSRCPTIGARTRSGPTAQLEQQPPSAAPRPLRLQQLGLRGRQPVRPIAWPARPRSAASAGPGRPADRRSAPAADSRPAHRASRSCAGCWRRCEAHALAQGLAEQAAALQVRQEATTRLVVGVAHIVPGEHTLARQCATSRHDEILEFSNKTTTRATGPRDRPGLLRSRPAPVKCRQPPNLSVG